MHFGAAVAEVLEAVLERTPPTDNEVAKKLLMAVLAYGHLVKQTFDKIGAQLMIPRSYNLLMFFAVKCYKVLNQDSPLQNDFNPH